MPPSEKCNDRVVAVGGIDWHAMARSEHTVHSYEKDASLIDLVGDFLAPGLLEGAACILVATPEHQALLEEPLRARGIDAAAVVERGLLTFCDAQTMLFAFLRNGAPDTALFSEVVGGFVDRAVRRTAVHPVRIFSEMVEVLAQQGATDAALRLDQLWTDLARIHPFSLLCANPVRRFGAAADVPFLHVGEEHSRLEPGESYRTAGSNARLQTLAFLEREVRTLDAELSASKRAQQQMESRLVEMAEASRRKDELLVALGAELRYPLAALRNALLAARLGPARPERALEIARRQSRELARHIDGLVDVTRVSQGRVAIERRPLALGEVLERAVEATRARFDARRHRLSISSAPKGVYVDGDRARLEQVVENLLLNAASCTPPDGWIQVTVEQHGSEAILSVADSGVGIDAERLPVLFEAFPPDDRDPGREHRRGLHIGLARAREIVELHGGQIEACSDGPDKGSEFIVRLPVLGTVPSRALGSDLEWSRSAHILVVADDPDTAEALAAVLDVLGHQVAVAHDGDGALRSAQRVPPELVLIDIDPATRGYELARRIRASADLGAVPLVGLSAHGQVEERQRAMDAGFCCLLSQPVEIEGLRAVLRLLPDRSLSA